MIINNSFIKMETTFFSLIIAIILFIQCENIGKISKETTHSGISAKECIKIMEYNVENLFDFVHNGNEYSEYIPNTHNWTFDIYMQKMENIASVIAAADPDIAVLCEVENKNAAMQLKKRLEYRRKRFKYCEVNSVHEKASTCQAILSKFPVISTTTHYVPVIDSCSSRDILESVIQLKNKMLTIFAVHLPSKKFKESYRIAAIKVLYKRLKELPPATDYIICGDFNSNYNESETFFTENLDNTNGFTGINHILKTVLSEQDQFLTFVSEQDLINAKGHMLHYNLWLELPEQKRFNYIHKGSPNTLDHILLPAALYDNSGISYLDNSFSVFRKNGLLIYNGIPLRWMTQRTGKGIYHTGRGYSDHLPIIACFTMNPFFPDPSSVISDKSCNTQYMNHNCRSFETGYEGWRACSDKIRISRDTVLSATGRYSLKIEGKPRENCKAAYIRIPLQPDKNSISFKLSGKAKINFIIRGDDKQKLCFAGEQFKKIMKHSEFTPFYSETWQSISLTIPANMLKNQKALQIECNSSKNEVIKLWLDDFKIE